MKKIFEKKNNDVIKYFILKSLNFNEYLCLITVLSTF